jgi:hypothetical protein
MMMMDIKKYYLGISLPTYEYMRLHLSIIPDEIITNTTCKQYQLEAECI